MHNKMTKSRPTMRIPPQRERERVDTDKLLTIKRTNTTSTTHRIKAKLSTHDQLIICESRSTNLSTNNGNNVSYQQKVKYNKPYAMNDQTDMIKHIKH